MSETLSSTSRCFGEPLPALRIPSLPESGDVRLNVSY